MIKFVGREEDTRLKVQIEKFPPPVEITLVEWRGLGSRHISICLAAHKLEGNARYTYLATSVTDVDRAWISSVKAFCSWAWRLSKELTSPWRRPKNSASNRSWTSIRRRPSAWSVIGLLLHVNTLIKGFRKRKRYKKDMNWERENRVCARLVHTLPTQGHQFDRPGQMRCYLDFHGVLKPALQSNVEWLVRVLHWQEFRLRCW